MQSISVDLSVVVAVYNEDPRNLSLMLERLSSVITPIGLSYEVVFVNDGSRAETSLALRQIVKESKQAKLVVLSRNFGQQAAISAGMDHSTGRAIVNIDSDLQDPPELIPKMVERWKEGYDVVYAQRQTRRDRVAKRLSAYLFYRILGSMSTVDIPWDTGDFRLIDRKVLNALNSLPEKTRFLRGLVPWLGFRQIGIAIERDAREVGESTYTLRKLLSLAMDGLLSFSVTPLYLIPFLGLAFIGLGIVALVAWLLLGAAHGGDQQTPAIILALAIFAGIQMLCTGIVAVYLSKVLDETRARPTYLVAERLGGSFEPAGVDVSPGSESQAVACVEHSYVR